MVSRLLMASVGLAVLLSAAGMVQVQRKDRTGASPARQAPARPAAEADPPTNPDSDKAPAKDGGATGSADAGGRKKAKPLEKATFGGGCFWCIEAVFERIPGVKSVVSGYAGGHVPNPSYEMVCTGLTGHAEVVQITYDPAVIPFEKLLKYFWMAHDPTTLNSQGPDFGTQYRSIILYHTPEQKDEAIRQYKELMAQRSRKSPIVTELVPFTEFYPADAYHQDYYRNHPDTDYSQTYIEPKVRKLQQKLRSETSRGMKPERPRTSR